MLKRLHHWANTNMPTREGMAQNKYVRPFAHRVLKSELWRFNRRSVPRGVALGMLTGVIIPIGQIFAAAVLALSVRANVPVAALTTFVTNPFTTPFIWFLSYKLGQSILRVDQLTYGKPLSTAVHTGKVGDWMEWLTGQAGVMAFGLVIFAILSAALGYVVASLGWRWWAGHKWRQRSKRRARVTASDTVSTG